MELFGGRRPRAPAEDLKADLSTRVEHDPLPFETEALEDALRSLLATWAYPAPGVDHAVPGNPAAVIQRGEGVADKARVAGQVREPCDLPVRRYPAARNPTDHGVDPLMAAG